MLILQIIILKYARQLLNLTQEELSEAVGISRSMITRIEAGTVPMQLQLEDKLLQFFSERGIDTEILMNINQIINEVKGGHLSND